MPGHDFRDMNMCTVSEVLLLLQQYKHRISKCLSRQDEDLNRAFALLFRGRGLTRLPSSRDAGGSYQGSAGASSIQTVIAPFSLLAQE